MISAMNSSTIILLLWGGHAFHCHHNDTQAIAKSDFSGYLVEQGVSRAEYELRADSAAQALAMIEASRERMN